MSGISQPDRQGWCKPCRRVVTAEGQGPVSSIVCPGCGVSVPTFNSHSIEDSIAELKDYGPEGCL